MFVYTVEFIRKRLERDQIELSLVTLERVFRWNFEIVRSHYELFNCYGWADADCENLSLLPAVSEDGRVVEIRTVVRSGNSSPLISLLRRAGCSSAVQELESVAKAIGDEVVEFSVVSISFSCQVSGNEILFSVGRGHPPGTDPTWIYYETPYVKMDVLSRKGALRRRRFVIFDEERAFGLEESRRRAVLLAITLRNFHHRQLAFENLNPCSPEEGGLNSWEDFVLPWIWRLVSETVELCEGTDNAITGCGCMNNAVSTYWRTSASYAVLGRKSEWESVLPFVDLPLRYKTDWFGNRFWLVILSDPDGTARDWSSTGDRYPLRPVPFSCSKVDCSTTAGVSRDTVSTYYTLDLLKPLVGLIGVVDEEGGVYSWYRNVVYDQ